MTVRMNGTLRRCLAGSALCGLIVLTAVPAAMALSFIAYSLWIAY